MRHPIVQKRILNILLHNSKLTFPQIVRIYSKYYYNESINPLALSHTVQQSLRYLRKNRRIETNGTKRKFTYYITERGIQYLKNPKWRMKYD